MSGQDGNDANGIGVMSTDFGNFFFFFSWCSPFKWQTRLTASEIEGRLRKKECLLGASVSTFKQWKPVLEVVIFLD